MQFTSRRTEIAPGSACPSSARPRIPQQHHSILRWCHSGRSAFGQPTRSSAPTATAREAVRGSDRVDKHVLRMWEIRPGIRKLACELRGGPPQGHHSRPAGQIEEICQECPLTSEYGQLVRALTGRSLAKAFTRFAPAEERHRGNLFPG